MDKIAVGDVENVPDAAPLVWWHALAVAYSSAWLTENRPAIRSGFPRIPLPADAVQLQGSAVLGREVAALLGRDLTMEEAEYVTQMARRIAALLLLWEKLDENYRRCRDRPFLWRSSVGPV